LAEHNELGKIGEQMAVAYLIKNGYTIKEQNWRFQKAEIDIIAQKKDVLAVVEVKTRTTDAFGEPQDFITAKKIKLLVKAIEEYVVTKNLDVEVRLDVIAIIKNKNETKITHLEDAFFHF